MFCLDIRIVQISEKAADFGVFGFIASLEVGGWLAGARLACQVPGSDRFGIRFRQRMGHFEWGFVARGKPQNGAKGGEGGGGGSGPAAAAVADATAVHKLCCCFPRLGKNMQHTHSNESEHNPQV